MKTKILLLFLFCWVAVVYGQANRLTDDEYKQLENLTVKQENGRNVVGYVKMNDKIRIYKKNSVISNDSATVDSVKIDIKEGLIHKLQVIANKKVFYKSKGPIPMLYEDIVKKSDTLFDKKKKEYILYSETIDFYFDEQFNSIPDNQIILLINNKIKEKENIKALIKNSNLSSFINFVAYSDLLGLIGDQANALVHFEANAKFYLHRNNIFKSFTYLFPTFQPSFSYNKLDSKFEIIPVMSKEVNSTDIFRRHNYSVGLDITVLKFDFLPNNSLDLNVGYQYVSSKILLEDDITSNTINAVSHLKSFDAVLKSRLAPNFGIDLSAKYIWQTLNPTDYYDRSQNHLLGFRGSIYYYPPKGNQGDKVFIRFTNYVALNNRSDDFSQFQIGFSKSLNFNSKN